MSRRFKAAFKADALTSGWTPRSDLDVMLFHGLAYEDEAYLFALQCGESKEVATASRLKALMLSNDSRACDFRSRTESAGFRLSPSGRTAAKCTLGCVAKLWRIFEEDAGLYSETLSLLMSAWHGEAWSLNANIVGGKSEKEQYDDLMEMGCQMYQGYYFAKPMPDEEFDQFFSTGKNSFSE